MQVCGLSPIAQAADSLCAHGVSPSPSPPLPLSLALSRSLSLSRVFSFSPPLLLASCSARELQVLESSVVDWSHQVNDILKHDSAQPLIDGLNVGPLTELDFRSSKMKNFEGIQDQLLSDAVQQIKVVLADARSSYTPVPEKVIDDVKNAYAECQDITLYLEPMRGLFEEVEETEFEKLNSTYAPLALPPLSIAQSGDKSILCVLDRGGGWDGV